MLPSASLKKIYFQIEVSQLLCFEKLTGYNGEMNRTKIAGAAIVLVALVVSAGWIFFAFRPHNLVTVTAPVAPADLFVPIETVGYSTDTQYVYDHGRVIKGADPKTFQAFSSGYMARDAHYVYLFGKQIEVADISTFAPIVDRTGGAFFKDAKEVYSCDYDCPDGGLKVIPGADPSTFTIVDQYYATDKNHVYFRSASHPKENVDFELSVIDIISGADPATFQPFSYPDSPGSPSFYARDVNNVYYKDELVAGADPMTFAALSGWAQDYGKDASHVFFKNQTIAGADVASFDVATGTPRFSLNGDYAWDRSNAYYDGHIISSVDIATFRALDDDYSRDAKNIYYDGASVPGADPKTFKILMPPYAEDATHVYYQGVLLDVSPADVKIPEPYYPQGENPGEG